MKLMKSRKVKSGVCGGFTLVELMIAVMLAGILSAMAVPFVKQWRTDLECRSAARNIVSILRDAKNRSISTNLEHRVEYEPGKRRYRLTQGNRPNNSNTWVTVVYDWSVLPSGVRFKPKDDLVVTIQINTNGTAEADTITIQDEEHKSKYSVIINSTGRIRSLKVS